MFKLIITIAINLNNSPIYQDHIMDYNLTFQDCIKAIDKEEYKTPWIIAISCEKESK